MQKRPSSERLKYRHYNLPVDYPMLVFLGDKWIMPPDGYSYVHFHNCLEIGFCHSGEGHIWVENKEIPFTAGDITFIPRNSVHKGQSAKETYSRWEYICTDPKQFLESSGIHIPDIDKLMYDSPDYRNLIAGKENVQIQTLVKRILKEFHDKEENYQMSIRGLFTALMVELTRILPQSTAINPVPNGNIVIFPAIVYINSHFSEKIRIENLAELCHMSVTHFRRLFKSVMGASPLDYINHLRIRKSCAYLYANKESIFDISKKFGFLTVSSFNRHFLDIMQTSPSQWRKQNASQNHANEISSYEEDIQHMFKL